MISNKLKNTLSDAFAAHVGISRRFQTEAVLEAALMIMDHTAAEKGLHQAYKNPGEFPLTHEQIILMAAVLDMNYDDYKALAHQFSLEGKIVRSQNHNSDFAADEQEYGTAKLLADTIVRDVGIQIRYINGDPITVRRALHAHSVKEQRASGIEARSAASH